MHARRTTAMQSITSCLTLAYYARVRATVGWARECGTHSSLRWVHGKRRPTRGIVSSLSEYIDLYRAPRRFAIDRRWTRVALTALVSVRPILRAAYVRFRPKYIKQILDCFDSPRERHFSSRVNKRSPPVLTVARSSPSGSSGRKWRTRFKNETKNESTDQSTLIHFITCVYVRTYGQSYLFDRPP